MTSYAELVVIGDGREAVARNEGQPFVRENPEPADGWKGPDAGFLRNREALQKRTDTYCDRIAARVRELGRLDLRRDGLVQRGASNCDKSVSFKKRRTDRRS